MRPVAQRQLLSAPCIPTPCPPYVSLGTTKGRAAPEAWEATEALAQWVASPARLHNLAVAEAEEHMREAIGDMAERYGWAQDGVRTGINALVHQGGEPHRNKASLERFHTLCAGLETYRDALVDPDTVCLALLFHGAVSCTGRVNHLAKKTALFEHFAREIHLGGQAIHTVVGLMSRMEAQAGHPVDHNFFLDLNGELLARGALTNHLYADFVRADPKPKKEDLSGQLRINLLMQALVRPTQINLREMAARRKNQPQGAYVPLGENPKTLMKGASGRAMVALHRLTHASKTRPTA